MLIDLKGYEGSNVNTCQANFKRNYQAIGISTSEENIQECVISGGGSSKTLFDDVTPSKFIYLETTGECAIQINDIDETTVKPIVVGDSTKKGVYFKSSDINKVIIGNDGAEDITIFYITSK